MPLLRFRLLLLGAFQLVDVDGRQIPIVSKKNRLLLALLALSPGKSLSREVLAGKLWGDHSDEQARNSLRQAIAVLRKELSGREGELFSSLDTTVALNPRSVEADVDQFKGDAERADAEGARRAISLWRGPFLADINAGEEDLDIWLAQQREFFSALYIRALDRLVTLASGHEQVGLAQRLVNFDNLREASHRRLMEAYRAQGERALALRHYEKARKLLRDEIGVEPSPETQELRDQIAASDPKHGQFGRGGGQPNAATTVSVEPERQVAMPMPRSTSWRWMGMAAIAVLAAVVAGTLWFQRSDRRTAAIEPSVAVLPFENLSGDPADGRFADGITVDTITDLSRYWDFTVIARESTEAYKGKAVDARQIGKDLSVTHILKGTFQRDGNQVRITAQLIDPATGTNIWSERFDRPAGEVFAVQSEVADRIANSLGGHNGLVTSSVITAAKRKRPADLGAYEIYLLARDTLQNEMSDQGMIKAQKLIDQALEKDPTFARAYVIYAWTYAWRHTFEAGANSLVQEMLKYARRGVDLDPMDADAHQALGYAYGLSGDLTQAKIQFDESLRLNPNSFDILTLYACWAHVLGGTKAGSNAADHAIRLNPNFPNWSIACLRLGMFMDGRYEDAIWIQSRQPESQWNTDGFVVTAGSLAALGRSEEAKALVARGIKQFPGLLSIERFALNRNWSSDAVPVMLDLMRKAGFPVCAKDSELADTPNPVRLPECVQPAKASELPLPDKPSIAVLPFDNLSGDERLGRLADGMVTDITNNLSRFSEFFVIARNSVFTYKAKPRDVRAVGAELGVRYVLEGSVQGDDKTLRVTTQLIDATTGTQVWSERYERPLMGLFTVQSDIMERIVASIGSSRGELQRVALAETVRHVPSNLDAYDDYLIAADLRFRLNQEDNAKAEKLLKEAIRLDPTLEPAWATLALVYWNQVDYAWGDRDQAFANWLNAASGAVALDPGDAMAHTALGLRHQFANEFGPALREFNAALEANPNHVHAITLIGGNLSFLEPPGRAVELVERAMRLNPRNKPSISHMSKLAYFFAGDFAKTIEEIHLRDELNYFDYMWLAFAHAELGQLPQAYANRDKVLKIRPEMSAELYLAEGEFAPAASGNRALFLDAWKKAGLPYCAMTAQLQNYPNFVRLPECKGISADGQRAALSTPTIAVLPFDNLAGDADDGRIADGITDDVITELSRFRDLDVIARNSTDVYRGTPIDVRQIGKDLNAGYVLEGSFQRQGDRIRVITQLIDTGTGHRIFSERFDNPSQDLFAVQAEVAAKVANSLGGVDGLVSMTDLLAAKRKQETDLNAYALYLLGDEARRGLTEDSLLRAEKILKQAIAADPTLARAHTSLANTYSRLMLFQTDMGPSTKLMLVEARRAIELDPLDARAHAALGYATAMTGDLKQAEIEYDKALGLNPNSFDVLKSYACFAFAFGKGEAGAQAVDRAIRLNPRYPDHGVDCFRYALFMVGRYEDAVRTQRRLPEEKWNPDGFAMTAGSLAALGREDEAKALAARGYAKFPTVLSVEKFALDRGWSPPESSKLLDLMRKAGFPLCAAKADLADNPKLVRLPECKAF